SRRQTWEFLPTHDRSIVPWQERFPRTSRMTRGCPPDPFVELPTSKDRRHSDRSRKKSRGARAACPRFALPTETGCLSHRECFYLGRVEQANSSDGKLDELVQLAAVECSVFSRTLYFHELSFAAHHNVHVDLGANIFFVIEIEPRFAVNHADAHGSDSSLHRCF